MFESSLFNVVPIVAHNGQAQDTDDFPIPKVLAMCAVNAECAAYAVCAACHSRGQHAPIICYLKYAEMCFAGAWCTPRLPSLQAWRWHPWDYDSLAQLITRALTHHTAAVREMAPLRAYVRAMPARFIEQVGVVVAAGTVLSVCMACEVLNKAA